MAKYLSKNFRKDGIFVEFYFNREFYYQVYFQQKLFFLYRIR